MRSLFTIFLAYLALSINANTIATSVFEGKRISDDVVQILPVGNQFFLFSNTLGDDNSGYEYDIAIRKLHSDLSIDTTFGERGTLTFDIPGDFNNSSFVKAAILDSSLIILANASNTNGTNSRKSIVLKLDFSGEVDSSFADNGIYQAIFHGESNQGKDFIIDDENKIVVIGTSTDPDQLSDPFSVFYRLLIDGSLDTSFGENGKLIVRSSPIKLDNFRTAHVAGGDSHSITQLSTGKYLISGEIGDGTAFLKFIMRINQTGIIDSTFGENGFVYLETTEYDIDRLSDLQELSNDKYVFLAQMNSILDNYTIGIVENDQVNFHSVANNDHVNYAPELLINNQQIYVLGRSTHPNNYSINSYCDSLLIFRYNSNGQLDINWGDYGIQSIQIANDYQVGANSFTISNDEILLTGRYYNSDTEYDPFVSRFDISIFTDLDEKINFYNCLPKPFF